MKNLHGGGRLRFAVYRSMVTGGAARLVEKFRKALEDYMPLATFGL
jgi:hypothetical protein